MQRLLNNWKLKFLSLVLAIGLWSHVRGEVNPWETASFRVPLGVAAPSRLLVLNRDKLPREVRVTLRAPRSRLRELKGFAPPNPLSAPEAAPVLNTGALRASLDFSLALSLARLGAQDVPVKIQAAVEDAEVIGVKPSDVVVQLDQAAQQDVLIEPRLAPARGYEIADVRLERAQATIFGPSKALARVQSVRALIRSGPLKLGEPQRIEAPLQAVDALGDKVREVTIEPSVVGALAILRQEMLEKEVPLQARVLNARPGQPIGEAQVLPGQLRLRGPRLELEKIGALLVPLDASLAQVRDGFLQRRVEIGTIKLPPRVEVLGQREVLVRAPLREF